MRLTDVTIAVPYYRNCAMLRRQIREWEDYPDGAHLVVIDDGSPEPAKEIIEAHASAKLLARIALYRILVDVPWNREEARNLAATQCDTDWLIQIDIDHLLSVESAIALFQFSPDPDHWYRFPRWRIGKADETRRKDAIADNVDVGKIHPHIDSYLVTKEMYWRAGGYDLAFSGCLGGGTDFLKRLQGVAEPLLLPDEISLHVYTRSVIQDASDWSLSRDRSEGKRRADIKKHSKFTAIETLRSAWQRQI